jgi:hypothetical protein
VKKRLLTQSPYETQPGVAGSYAILPLPLPTTKCIDVFEFWHWRISFWLLAGYCPFDAYVYDLAPAMPVAIDAQFKM